MKFNSKPYTGIHKEIFDLIVPRRSQYQDPAGRRAPDSRGARRADRISADPHS